jgi:hypothetical protein
MLKTYISLNSSICSLESNTQSLKESNPNTFCGYEQLSQRCHEMTLTYTNQK